MWIYRISKKRYNPLDSAGVRLQGGRWNSAGRAIVYCSDSFAGAILEILAHARPRMLPGLHHCARIEVPDDVEVESLAGDDLPDWDAPDRRVSREFGDRWFDERRSVLLLVPAASARPYGRNAVLNPDHADFVRLVVEAPADVPWDPRLF